MLYQCIMISLLFQKLGSLPNQALSVPLGDEFHIKKIHTHKTHVTPPLTFLCCCYCCFHKINCWVFTNDGSQTHFQLQYIISKRKYSVQWKYVIYIFRERATLRPVQSRIAIYIGECASTLYLGLTNPCHKPNIKTISTFYLLLDNSNPKKSYAVHWNIY